MLLTGCSYQRSTLHRFPSNSVSQSSGRPLAPDIQIMRLFYTVYGREGLLWKVKAARADIYKNKEILFQNVYAFSGRKGVSIKAEEGVYYLRPKKFIFKGHVCLKTKKYGSLWTERLVYLPDQHILETRAAVLIRHQGLIMKGKGFVYDLETGTFKILHKTRVQVEG